LSLAGDLLLFKTQLCEEQTVMQSQEGMPGPLQYQVPDEQKINTDPREQRQWQVTPAQEQSYEERSYEEGYVSLDADDMWQPRNRLVTCKGM
jgi:hypothetical protein